MNLGKQIIPKTAKGAFWLSFWLCLLACLFIIFVISPLTGLSKHFGKANDGYIQIARSLAHGHGYVFEEGGPAVFHRPPLYPFLLVPITFLPDFCQRPALILMQSVMVGFIGALLFQIARRLFNISTAKAAVIIFLLYPWVYWNAKNPMTPILQGLLYTLFAVLLCNELLDTNNQSDLSTYKTKSRTRRIWLGIAAAALALTHGAMLAVNIILLFILFIVGIARHNHRAIKTSVTAVVIMVAVIAPWTYRNWVVFHRFIPVVTGSSLAYFNGNAHWQGIVEEPRRKGEGFIDASLRLAGIEGTEQRYTHWKGFKDIEVSDRADKEMIEHLRSNPGAFVKKVLLNAVEYYFPMFTYPYLAIKGFNIEKLVITIFHSSLWILAVIGIFRARKRQIPLLPTGLMLSAIILYACWYFPFATFIGHSLYTFGTIPFLAILAARGLLLQEND